MLFLVSLLFFVFIETTTIDTAALPKQRAITRNCTQLQTDALANVLGGAFNERYMSIEPPVATTDDNDLDTQNTNASRNRRNDYSESAFAVNGDDFQPAESHEPAWRTVFGRRFRRSPAYSADIFGKQPKRPWSCRGQIKWLDLGTDYFPRFLRTIDCLKQKCWYGHGKCQARSFLVRILRRRRGECETPEERQTDADERNESDGYLPAELRELWTWEEYPVNFCCECCAG